MAEPSHQTDRLLDHSRVDELLVAATQDDELRRVVTSLLTTPDRLTDDARRRLDDALAALDTSCRHGGANRRSGGVVETARL